MIYIYICMLCALIASLWYLTSSVVVWTVDEKEESFNMDISKSRGRMLAG